MGGDPNTAPPVELAVFARVREPRNGSAETDYSAKPHETRLSRVWRVRRSDVGLAKLVQNADELSILAVGETLTQRLV